LLAGTAQREACSAPLETPPHDFEVQVRCTDVTHATLRLQGDLDLAAADLFAAVIRHHLATGHRYVRLDLSGLSFVDCTGLRALLTAHHELLARGGRLSLANVGPRTARLLRLTLLDAVLYVEGNARS
jgi:anti-anti-sigma factor